MVDRRREGTEREFQNVAKLRLNMLFVGSTEGAHRACVLLGIIATCRALAVPVQAYLTWAFVRWQEGDADDYAPSLYAGRASRKSDEPPELDAPPATGVTGGVTAPGAPTAPVAAAPTGLATPAASAPAPISAAATTAGAAAVGGGPFVA